MCYRTLADPEKPDDVKATNALQYAIRIERASPGSFEVRIASARFSIPGFGTHPSPAPPMPVGLWWL
jgi:hypothetical protein